MNTVVHGVKASLRCDHHFTTAYSPWANGTVERANRDILSCLRALCVEFRLELDQWPSLIPLVVSSMNFSPSSRLDGLSPVEVFLGIKPTSPLDSVFHPDLKSLLSPSSPTPDVVSRWVRSLRASLRRNSERVQLPKSFHADRRGKASAKPRPGVVPVDFSVGDWVLVALSPGERRSKLLAAWKGPYQVVDTVSSLVFMVKNPVSNAVSQVHACRLKRYADKTMDLTVPMKELISSVNGRFDVASILDHRRVSSPSVAFELLVSWVGFESVCDSWEPFDAISSGAPNCVSDYLTTVSDDVDRSEMSLRLSSL